MEHIFCIYAVQQGVDVSGILVIGVIVSFIIGVLITSYVMHCFKKAEERFLCIEVACDLQIV